MDEKTFVRELSNYNERLREAEEQIVRLQDQLHRTNREAIHDRETTLLSTAYFHTRLQEELVRSERYRHFLSLILVHLDFQDKRSTAHITQELKRTGGEMTSGLTRRTDIVALYRRCQMVIILPETDERGADILIQRYRAMFPDNHRLLTYSALTYPRDASNIELVLNRLQDLSEILFRGSAAHFLSHPPHSEQPLPPGSLT